MPSLWRREPFRVFFPLGWLLALWGTGPWLLLALGADAHYRSIFHAMAQVQGFLTCYALGFLLTFVPRRTRTEPPPLLLMVVALACPVLTTAFAFAERWAASQGPWIVLLVVMTSFVVRRARRGAGVLPPSLVWVPLTLTFALAGTVITGAAAALGGEWMWLHDVARGAVLQATFTGLMLGVGPFFLRMLTYGEVVDGGRRAPHVAAAVIFFASFALEGLHLSAAAYALRALVAAAVWIGGARLHRWPTQAGTHRKLAWLGAWCIPLGFALVAALPAHRHVGLHLVFIGGFAMSAFVVSAHVALSHGGAGAALGAPWPAARLLLALLTGAFVCRALVVLEPTHYRLWLGGAAGAFLLAALTWAKMVWAALARRKGEGAPP